MSLADKIAEVSNSIYNSLKLGQPSHIIAPKGIVDLLDRNLRHKIDGFTFYLKSNDLSIKMAFEGTKEIFLQGKETFHIDADDITDEIYLDAVINKNYKVVKRTQNEQYIIHHYVRMFKPDLYNKYKLLYEENF